MRTYGRSRRPARGQEITAAERLLSELLQKRVDTLAKLDEERIRYADSEARARAPFPVPLPLLLHVLR